MNDTPPQLDPTAGLGAVVGGVNANAASLYALVAGLKSAGDALAAAMASSAGAQASQAVTLTALAAQVGLLAAHDTSSRQALTDLQSALVAEASARAAADASEAASRTAGDSAEATARIAADNAEVVARAAADTAEAAARVAGDSAITARLPRSAPSVPVPAVTTVVGTATIDVSLTWATPWPDTNYSVTPVMDAAASLLGKTSGTVKSTTTTGCVITVTTSAVLAAGQVSVRAISVTK